jgi:hypothetical protein
VPPFKGIFCNDISEFESYMPSHAVRSPRAVSGLEECATFLRVSERLQCGTADTAPLCKEKPSPIIHFFQWRNSSLSRTRPLVVGAHGMPRSMCQKVLGGNELHQPVSGGDLPVERCAQLRRALLGSCIVDVEEPETGAEAVGPLQS